MQLSTGTPATTQKMLLLITSVTPGKTPRGVDCATDRSAPTRPRWVVTSRTHVRTRPRMHATCGVAHDDLASLVSIQEQCPFCVLTIGPQCRQSPDCLTPEPRPCTTMRQRTRRTLTRGVALWPHRAGGGRATTCAKPPAPKATQPPGPSRAAGPTTAATAAAGCSEGLRRQHGLLHDDLLGHAVLRVQRDTRRSTYETAMYVLRQLRMRAAELQLLNGVYALACTAMLPFSHLPGVQVARYRTCKWSTCPGGHVSLAGAWPGMHLHDWRQDKAVPGHHRRQHLLRKRWNSMFVRVVPKDQWGVCHCPLACCPLSMPHDRMDSVRTFPMQSWSK